MACLFRHTRPYRRCRRHSDSRAAPQRQQIAENTAGAVSRHMPHIDDSTLWDTLPSPPPSTTAANRGIRCRCGMPDSAHHALQACSCTYAAIRECCLLEVRASRYPSHTCGAGPSRSRSHGRLRHQEAALPDGPEHYSPRLLFPVQYFLYDFSDSGTEAGNGGIGL